MCHEADFLYHHRNKPSLRSGILRAEDVLSVRLVKEPDNEVDTEAIKVELEGLGHVGYVANNPYTVAGESYSAGRLYDKIGDTAEGTVLYVLPKGVLCYVNEESLLTAPAETDAY